MHSSLVLKNNKKVHQLLIAKFSFKVKYFRIQIVYTVYQGLLNSMTSLKMENNQ